MTSRSKQMHQKHKELSEKSERLKKERAELSALLKKIEVELFDIECEKYAIEQCLDHLTDMREE